MTALLLNGKALSQEIESILAKRLEHIKKKYPFFNPTLATILVGDDPASATYVHMKAQACARIGMTSKKILLSKDINEGELLKHIHLLNADPHIHGILLQHPLPHFINERHCFDAIAIGKDVDGVTSHGFGKMVMGETAFHSATPFGIMTLLNHYHIPIKGLHAVVVGRSPILGKPIAMMLLNANATVTICHSKTQHLPDILLTADLIVGALGQPEFIQPEWVKPGAILIDAGYHPGGIGDIKLDAAATQKCAAYTPVPGGVGPMTIASLMSQTLQAAEILCEIEI